MSKFFRQYFFAMDHEEMPFNRAELSWVYRAAKDLDNTAAIVSEWVLCHNNVQAKGELHMLILTRRPGETLIIETPAGELIKVTVTGIKGNQVRIGTDAPDNIAIVRAELLDNLQDQA